MLNMYKKNKMLSAIAAVAVLSSGAIAFDITNSAGDSNATPLADANSATTGYVTDSYTGQMAYYKDGVYTNENLRLSTSLKGDALIYPAFSQDNGWETDITVRNVKDVAIIAKAVIYRDTDSREMLDFNIYLSAHDVGRFTIKNGKVTTQDGSIIGSIDGAGTVRNPGDNDDFITEDALKDTSLDHIDKLVGEFDEDTFKQDYNGDGTKTWPGGYVIVYGMMQAEPKADGVDNIVNRDATYHNKHKELFYDYRAVLDWCRDDSVTSTKIPGWREAYNGFFGNGMMAVKDVDNNPVFVPSPNVDPACMDGISKSRQGKDNMLAEFEDTSDDALIGEVEISYPEGDQRNLLLPATALANFTVKDMIMLWAEGEYASIQDRRLSAGGTSKTSVYNIDGLREDAKAFLINRTYYTYKEGNAQDDAQHRNTILLTQPMKRPLIQAGNLDRYWRASATSTDVTPNYSNLLGSGWGYFEFSRNVYDENEREYSKEAGLTNITSPYNASIQPDPYEQELQPIRDLEEDLPEDAEYFRFKTNGYVDITIKNIPRKLPAIVTQMTSSKVGGESQTNWIYSPVDVVK
jgi:hypothetical protein